MSLLDQVRKLEQQLVSRLKELEPLTREYEQLRQLAQRLGIPYSPGTERAQADEEPSAPAATRRSGAAKQRTAARSAAKPPAAGRSSRAKRAKPRTGAARKGAGSAAAASKPAKPARRASARKPAGTRPGQRFDDVLRVVTANPGITVREVGAQLGVDATGLYRVANRLTQDGSLRKDGTKLYAVEPGAAAPPAPPTPTDDGADTSAAPTDASAGEAPAPDAGTADAA
jgi:hypothetical protein